MQWCGWDTYIWQVVFLQINVLAHLPNLHDVVFGNAGHHPATTRQTRSPREVKKKRKVSEDRICVKQTEDAKQQDEPGIVGVPAKIRNLGSVTSMHEQQLWGAVAGIFQAELLADAT